MPAPLPDFADAWIQQWKSAAPKLQAIRDEQLRRRGDGGGCDLASVHGVRLYERYPERHGMVIMRQWFAVRQLRESLDRINPTPIAPNHPTTPPPNDPTSPPSKR